MQIVRLTRRPGSPPSLYGRLWRIESKRFLARPENGLCVYCQRAGRMAPSYQVDHIVPHRGNLALFWDRKNWQPLCMRCGAEKSAREQASYRTGRPVVAKGCGPDGLPIDPRHSWNRRR